MWACKMYIVVVGIIKKREPAHPCACASTSQAPVVWPAMQWWSRGNSQPVPISWRLFWPVAPETFPPSSLSSHWRVTTTPNLYFKIPYCFGGVSYLSLLNPVKLYTDLVQTMVTQSLGTTTKPNLISHIKIWFLDPAWYWETLAATSYSYALPIPKGPNSLLLPFFLCPTRKSCLLAQCWLLYSLGD